jgi:hypothetical protein
MAVSAEVGFLIGRFMRKSGSPRPPIRTEKKEITVKYAILSVVLALVASNASGQAPNAPFGSQQAYSIIANAHNRELLTPKKPNPNEKICSNEEIKARLNKAEQERDAAKAGTISSKMQIAERRTETNGKIAYKFRSNSDKDHAVGKWQSEANLARLALVTNRSQESAPLNPADVEVGSKGRIRWKCEIITIIDNRSMIVHVSRFHNGVVINMPYSSRPDEFELQAFDTKNYADGKAFELDGDFEVTGTSRRGETTYYVLKRAFAK